jgi:hypothetical protein
VREPEFLQGVTICRSIAAFDTYNPKVRLFSVNSTKTGDKTPKIHAEMIIGWVVPNTYFCDPNRQK